MRSSTTYLLPRAVRIAVMVALVPISASADFRDSFRSGILAYRAEKWPTVVVLMRQAIQEEPRESERERVGIAGMESVPYLPSYFLGDALLRQGDCAGALAAFEVARKTDAAKDRNRLKRMDQARANKCGTSLSPGPGSKPVTPPPPPPADLGAAIAQAEPAINEARSARERVEKLKDRPFGGEALAAVAGEMSAATSALTSAEQRLGQAKGAKDAPGARDAERMARAAIAQFNGVEARVEERIRLLSDAYLKRGDDARAKDAAAKLERQQRAAQTARTALQKAKDMAASYVASSGGRPGPKALQDATAELNSVAEIVRRGTTASEDELASAAGTANRIRELFERERDALTSKDVGAAETLLTSAATSLKTLRDLARTTGRPAALDAAQLAQEELRRLRDRLGGASRRDRDALSRIVAGARALDERLTKMVRTFGQGAAPVYNVPPDLLQGAQAFFAGRYQEAVTQLEALRLPRGASSGVRLQAHLLRAAALFSAWALDREQDDVRRQAAAAAVAECRRLEPQFQPDATVFSPRFVRFYQSVK